MKKIRRLSLTLQVIIALAFVLLPFYTVVFWLSNGHPFGAQAPIGVFLYEGPVQPLVSILPPNVKAIAFLVNMIPVTLYMVIIAFLMRLFHLYGAGEVFSARVVKLYQKIAWVLLTVQLIKPFYSTLMGYVLTLINPPGQRMLYIGLNIQDFLMICVAGVVLLVSWIVAEYYTLHEEQEYTV